MKLRRWLLAAMFLSLAPVASAQEKPKPIRVWGYEGLKPLMLRWEADYQRAHPEITFENTFHGAAAAAAGLYDGAADVTVMGREFWTVDSMAFHWVFQYAPFSVDVVAAGDNAPMPSFSPVVIVNRANPLTAITVVQLDAIFGSEHKVAPANARQWSDLGVDVRRTGSAIIPVGFEEDAALQVYWRKRVLMEDYKPNPASLLLKTDTEIARRVAANPAAIGYTSGRAARAKVGVKVIPVDGVLPDGDAIAAGTYPLARRLSLYVNRKPGERIEPSVEGFLLFCLSDAAQDDLRPGEGFVALPAETRMKMQKRIQGDWTKAATNAEWKQ